MFERRSSGLSRSGPTSRPGEASSSTTVPSRGAVTQKRVSPSIVAFRLRLSRLAVAACSASCACAQVFLRFELILLGRGAQRDQRPRALGDAGLRRHLVARRLELAVEIGERAAAHREQPIARLQLVAEPDLHLLDATRERTAGGRAALLVERHATRRGRGRERGLLLGHGELEIAPLRCVLVERHGVAGHGDGGSRRGRLPATAQRKPGETRERRDAGRRRRPCGGAPAAPRREEEVRVAASGIAFDM